MRSRLVIVSESPPQPTARRQQAVILAFLSRRACRPLIQAIQGEWRWPICSPPTRTTSKTVFTCVDSALDASTRAAPRSGSQTNELAVRWPACCSKAGHLFTTNSGDQTVSMIDLKTLALITKVKIGPGLDGIMYDEPDDKIILTNHSRPGTLTALDPASGDVVATVELEDNGPEGAAADGKGHSSSTTRERARFRSST